MTPGSFKCPKCDRSFSMAAHLGRHANTIHGSRKGPKPVAKRKPGRPRKNRVGRPKGSRSFARAGAATGEGVTRLLSQMQSFYSELTARRSSLDAQIAGMEGAINILGAAPKAGATGRKLGRPSGSGSRAGSLKDTIVRVLRQRAVDSGVTLWLVGLNPGVLEVVRRSGLGDRLGRERMLFNARAAIARYQSLPPDAA